MNPIDAALLPPLWAIVRDYFYPAEHAMMAGLGLALTAGAIIPTELNLVYVVRDGQLNVLQWLHSAPLPPQPKEGRGMYDTCDIMWRPPGGQKRTMIAGIDMHRVDSQHRPHVDYTGTHAKVAIFCDHLDILKWMNETHDVEFGDVYLNILKYMSLEALQWMCSRCSWILTGSNRFTGWSFLGYILSMREYYDEAPKRAWLQSVVTPEARADALKYMAADTAERWVASL